MREPRRAGPYWDTVDAPSPSNSLEVVKLGITSAAIQGHAARGMKTAIAQYYGIVQDGLIGAVHLFRGVNRPLMLGSDMQADKGVIIYTWRPQCDWEWSGSQFDGAPIRVDVPPAGLTWVVLVREDLDAETGVIGSIEKWNWVEADPKLAQAPKDWADRYDTKVWSSI